MSFDVQGARKEGYSDSEIADFLASQRKFDLIGARKEGYSDTEIVDHLNSTDAVKSEETTIKEKPSYITADTPSGVAAQTAKDVAGLGVKMAGGFVKGATLSAVNPIEGTVGIPFTSIKKKYAPALNESLQSLGINTEQPYIDTDIATAGAEMSAIMAPWSATTKLVDKGVTAARMAINPARELGTVVSSEKIGTLAGMARRAAEQATTGAIIGAAEVRDKPELSEMLKNSAITAGLGAALQVGTEGVLALLNRTALTRYGAYQKLKQDMSDIFFEHRTDPNVTKAQADKAAEAFIHSEAAKAGVDLGDMSAKDIRAAARKVRAAKGKQTEQPTAAEEPPVTVEQPSIEQPTQAGAPEPPLAGESPTGPIIPGAPAPTMTTRAQKLTPEFFRDVQKAITTGVDSEGKPFTQDDAKDIYEAYKAQPGADPVSVRTFELLFGNTKPKTIIPKVPIEKDVPANLGTPTAPRLEQITPEETAAAKDKRSNVELLDGTEQDNKIHDARHRFNVKNKRNKETLDNVKWLEDQGITFDESMLSPENGSINHVTNVSKNPQTGVIQIRIENHTSNSTQAKLVSVKSGDIVKSGMDDAVEGTTRYEGYRSAPKGPTPEQSLSGFQTFLEQGPEMADVTLQKNDILVAHPQLADDLNKAIIDYQGSKLNKGGFDNGQMQTETPVVPEAVTPEGKNIEAARDVYADTEVQLKDQGYHITGRRSKSDKGEANLFAMGYRPYLLVDGKMVMSPLGIWAKAPKEAPKILETTQKILPAETLPVTPTNAEVVQPAANVETKEPWQMTQDEFNNQYPDNGRSDHEMYVQGAVSRGLPVPPEVLKDYPELVGKVEQATTEAPALEVKAPAKGKGAKIEFKVGDILDPRGNTNMVGTVTIREIQGNTLKFVDSNGTEFSGMQKSIVRDLINGGSWSKAQEAKAPATVSAHPAVQIADIVAHRLTHGGPITANELFSWADAAYGGTQAEGKYSVKGAYDAMELGVNKAIERAYMTMDPTLDAKGAQNVIAGLKKNVMDNLPTQSKRTTEMDKFQQFSTPPTISYVANWVANIQKGETYLEPSAGIGGLAVFGKNAGAHVIVNELSSRRRALLEQMGFDQVLKENAEQLNNILPKDIKPTVIVMNPPFSATAGRLQTTSSMEGFKHVEQALKRLEPNGRAVIILGKGVTDTNSFRKWLTSLGNGYTLKADIGISGKEYQKYGTTFGNQLLVFDKTEQVPGVRPVTADVEKVEDAIDLLKGVRDERIKGEQKAPEQKGEGIPQTSEGTAGPVKSVLPATGEVGAGTRGTGNRLPGKGVPADINAGTARPGNEKVGGTPDVLGRPERVPEPIKRPQDTGRPGVVSAGQGAGNVSAVSGTEPVTGSELKLKKAPTEQGKNEELSDSIYENYKPQKVNIAGAKSHPGKLVESAAMSVVDPPDPTYTPNLPQKIIKEGKLSSAQLESIVYAGQAHSEILPSGDRKGYFIGDGTGVGKGREIAGILLDNWRQGRTRAIWISQNSPLIEDAKRDVKGIGWDENLILDLSKAKIASEIPKDRQGVYFLGYPLLKMEDNKCTTEAAKAAGETPNSRLKQVVDWFGKDYDGVIIFDEAHNMGNALAVKGKRGTSTPSKIALSGIRLQKELPNARVVYVSATGATEVMNLSYADRLGLWGEGTPFANKGDFINQISSGGIAAMELVARDMKAMGNYLARSLSFDDVKYEPLHHELTAQQRELYDEFAGAWQIVLSDINAALKITLGAKNGKGKGAALAQFWGSSQRFFNQVITSMQTPAVVNSIEKDLAAGHAVVLQIVNTQESQTNRALARMEEGDELEDLDLTPKEQIMDYVKNSFPVAQYQPVEDAEGNITYVVVTDSNGVPVENADAVALREELLNKLGSIRGIDGPMEILLNHFGTDKIAEITGRTRRVVYAKDDNGNKVKVIERRSKAKTMADADAFMNDKKPILIFSYAGGTGRSYHADLAVKNQRLRRHYLLQAGWRADRAIQGFGRTHRSSQKQAPEYILVTTDIIGQKRFISSIARRLDQLGALTRGQRETGSGGFFTARDNLESTYAQDALDNMIMSIYHHDGIMTMSEFIQQTGLHNLINTDTGQLNENNMPTVTQFLNRLLAMTLDNQAIVFEDFSQRMDANIRQAMESGDLDVGLETLKAKNIKKVSEQIVHTDKSGAQTKYVELDVTKDAHLLPFSETSRGWSEGGFYQNVKSGQVWMASMKKLKTNPNTGEVTSHRTLRGPARTSHDVTEDHLFDTERYTAISDGKAKTLWNEQHDALPKVVTYRENLITGTILPIWDRLKGKARIMRVQTDNGGRMIGRLIPHDELTATLQNLGVSSSKTEHTPKDIFHQVRDQGFQVELANGWKIIRRRVSGENRIELVGPDYRHMQELSKHGVFDERIQYQTRYFIPTTEEGIKTIEAITSNRPVVNTIAPTKIREDLGQGDQYSATPDQNPTPTLADVQDVFKGQEVIQPGGENSPIYVKTRGGKYFTVETVNEISPKEVAFEYSYGTKFDKKTMVIAGSYGDGVIRLVRGLAGKWTLQHEQIHALEDAGIINSSDVAILKGHIKGLVRDGKRLSANKDDIGGPEDRANFIADELTKETPKKGLVGRVIARIREFIDRLMQAFGKKRTAENVVKDIKSGKIFEGEGKAGGQGEHYSVQSILSNKEGYKKAEPSEENPTTPDGIKAAIKNETDVILQEFIHQLTPDIHKMSGLKKFLSAPEWYEHPVLSRIVRIFVRDRAEIRQELMNYLNNLEQPQNEINTVGELALNLKHKGLNWKQKMTGKASKDYQDLEKILDGADIDNITYTEANLKKQGYSDATIKVWRAMRDGYDKELDLKLTQMKEMINQIEEEAAFKGISPVDYSDIYLTLKGALASMGELRGSYAPRIRQGDWAVTARRPQTIPGHTEEYEYYRGHKFSHMAANRLAGKLRTEGWEVQHIGEVQKLPEDVYQDIKTISVAKAIEAALDGMSKGKGGDVTQEQTLRFNEDLLRNVAEEIKARGFRSSEIRRSQGVAVSGYITDPVERFSIHMSNTASGMAKAQTAQAAMEQLLGQTVKGRRFGGIDPKAEPEIYSTAKDYIEEQLRNADKSDRVIGLAKSIATLRFLGFSVRSAVVNTTSIVTTSPGAIHQYVTEGKVGIMKIQRYLGVAGKDAAKFMAGKFTGTADEIKFLQDEKRLGWDDPQYTRDMISKIGSTGNKTWAATMDGAMWMFGKTEQWNRLTTMLASYRLARSIGKTHGEAAELAKTASDKSQGTYGKATLPSVAWGRNPAAKVAQMIYTYTKFSHNYLHLLRDLGFKKGNWKAFFYTLLAPMILSGAAAFPLKDITIMPLLGILLTALGIKDKNEGIQKWIWDQTRKYLGEGAEIAGRYGIMGASGLDVSGSLSIGVGIPKDFWEWGGAIGGAAKEVKTAWGEARKGNYFQTAEHLLPAGLANVTKAVRESSEGVTTQRGNRVFDKNGRPFEPTAGETAKRVLGFRSARQAATTERLYEAKKQVSEFNDKRSTIYETYRAYLTKPEGRRDPDQHKKIREQVREFNKSIRTAHMTGEVADITYESMRRQMEKMKGASKKERAMMR